MDTFAHGVVCICSRGLVFSRTIEATDKNMKRARGNWVREFTHCESIPEAQNIIVEQARQHNPKWLWFVEEDMVPPPSTLKKLLKCGEEYDVVSAKYRLSGGSWAHFEAGDKLVFAGLGCLLVKMEVFDKMEKPYFRTDRQYSLDLTKFGKNKAIYGGQDIYFFAMLKEHNIKSKLADVKCEHLYVQEFGNVTDNVGYHKVEAL